MPGMDEDPLVQKAVEVLASRDGFTPEAAREDLERVADDLGVPVTDVAATLSDTADVPAEGPLSEV